MYEHGVVYQDAPEEEPYIVVDGERLSAELIDRSPIAEERRESIAFLNKLEVPLYKYA